MTFRIALSTTADIPRGSAAKYAFSLTKPQTLVRSFPCGIGGNPSFFLESTSTTFQVRLNMSWREAILESGCIPGAWKSANHALVFFRMVYPTAIPVVSVRKQLNIYVIMFVLSSNISCKKTRTLNLQRLLTVQSQLSMLEMNFNIGCKYCPPLRNVTGLCTSQKHLKKNRRSLMFL